MLLLPIKSDGGLANMCPARKGQPCRGVESTDESLKYIAYL